MNGRKSNPGSNSLGLSPNLQYGGIYLLIDFLNDGRYVSEGTGHAAAHDEVEGGFP